MKSQGRAAPEGLFDDETPEMLSDNLSAPNTPEDRTSDIVARGALFGVFGHLSTPIAALGLPLAVQEMVFAVWLIVKGSIHL